MTCSKLVLTLALPFLGLGADRRFEPLPGQRIAFLGDSIVRGYAFGNYTDPSPLRTLYGMANLLLQANLPHAPQALRLQQGWKGFGPDGTPAGVDSLAGEIKYLIRRGDLRTGDWLIYEDAGQLDMFEHPAPWPNQKDIYRRYRKALRDMVEETDDAIGRDHIIFMTMFDYAPKCKWCAWDAPLDDGVHSGNDAIRDEASALGVRLVDMNSIMDAANAHAVKAGWGRLVGPDGIHPNVYGNFVMVLAVLRAAGADIAQWDLDPVAKRFRHPGAGGDVATIWGFSKDPSDAERVALLSELRRIVLSIPQKPASAAKLPPTGSSIRRVVRYGRLLDRPARQPEGTNKPASYEVGKLIQLDREHAMLTASLREQGGHDFAIGNDAFIFRNLDEIVPGRAIELNRLEPNHVFKNGTGTGVQAKFPGTGGFVPLGARLPDGSPHPHAGTGFYLSATDTFTSDRTDHSPNSDDMVELLQLAWDGKALKVEQGVLPDSVFGMQLFNIGFQCLPEASGFLCPLVATQGVVVMRFERQNGRWKPTAAGKPFFTLPGQGGEWEPSLRKVDGLGYLVYNRCKDRRGRVYQSSDGLNYHLLFENMNHTVPQSLNEGLDGSLYLSTNTGPGWLRNPLLLFSMRGYSFGNPLVIHDEKQIHEDLKLAKPEKEVPFVDHPMGTNIFLNGRWRHILLYRVCDLRETNGEGAPPTPQTGLYAVELEYDDVKPQPFFAETK